MNKQLGGTLIGFVIGLLVGLGLALAVAVYVTKVPVPFVDRGVSRKPTQDAIEAEKNRNWNPNAGLAGSKPAAAPKPEGDATEGAVKSEGKPAPAPASAPSLPAANKPEAAKPAASADPLGDLARSRTQATPAQPPAAAASADAEPFIYFVQAGAFRTAADAEAQRAKLAMLGFDAKVSEREQAGQTVYRVRTGPHRAKADADATQAKLASNNIDAALVRVQR
jgi:cell division protein FtsN